MNIITGIGSKNTVWSPCFLAKSLFVCELEQLVSVYR